MSTTARRLWSNPGEALDYVRRSHSRSRDVLKVNEGELTLLTGHELDLARSRLAGAGARPRRRTLLDLGPTLVIVTLGPNGALLPHGDGRRLRSRLQGRDGRCDRLRRRLYRGAALATGPRRRRHHGPGRRPGPPAIDLLPSILRYANAVGALTRHAPRGHPLPSDCSGSRGVPPAQPKHLETRPHAVLIRQGGSRLKTRGIMTSVTWKPRVLDAEGLKEMTRTPAAGRPGRHGEDRRSRVQLLLLRGDPDRHLLRRRSALPARRSPTGPNATASC